jgi:hypothetical protein
MKVKRTFGCKKSSDGKHRWVDSGEYYGSSGILDSSKGLPGSKDTFNPSQLGGPGSLIIGVFGSLAFIIGLLAGIRYLLPDLAKSFLPGILKFVVIITVVWLFQFLLLGKVFKIKGRVSSVLSTLLNFILLLCFFSFFQGLLRDWFQMLASIFHFPALLALLFRDKECPAHLSKLSPQEATDRIVTIANVLESVRARGGRISLWQMS